jgi:hypothetical protein
LSPAPEYATEFGMLEAAVRADSSLQQRIVRLLMRCLRLAVPAVVALQEAADSSGRSSSSSSGTTGGAASHSDWTTLRNTCGVLLADSLRPALDQALHAQQPDVQLLLAELLDTLPCGCPEGMQELEFLETWTSAGNLLDAAIRACKRRLQDESQQQDHTSAAGWRAARVVPRLAAVLRAVSLGSPPIQRWLARAYGLMAAVPRKRSRVRSPISSSRSLG